jgi:DnaJ-class molecular chaperone
MPPVNFATLEIELLEGDEMTRAGSVLGVAPTASLDDVRSAYRRMARAAHPDAADRRDGKVATMAALSDAYRMLARYARARAADRRGSPCAGDPNMTAPAVLVSIRRQNAMNGAGRIAAES